MFISPYASYDYLANTVFYYNLFAQDLAMIFFLPNITWLNVWMIIIAHACIWGAGIICSSLRSLSGFVPYMSMQ